LQKNVVRYVWTYLLRRIWGYTVHSEPRDRDVFQLIHGRFARFLGRALCRRSFLFSIVLGVILGLLLFLVVVFISLILRVNLLLIWFLFGEWGLFIGS
jgi:hypothetical protein